MSEQPAFTYTDYLSPFTWRYGGDEMRTLWSEAHKRRLWRRLWVALAAAQRDLGLVSDEQLHDVEAHADELDIPRALAIEAETHHDLMAELKTFAERCPVGGGILHLGATSMDIEDNADALRLRDGLGLIVGQLTGVLLSFADQIDTWRHTATMAFTHLQPAEPTTIGFRLAQHAQDLMTDLSDLSRLGGEIRGKGLKGACGTSASYTQLLSDREATAADLEARFMANLGLGAFTVATQTYPRKQDFRILSALAGLGQSLYKFAADLRLLQSPPLGEWAEPFGEHQVGSSAMPFKRNPINAENMCSLARLLAALPRVAWDNAAHSYLERTLDDSANRRVILPEAFLISDELLRRAHKLISGLRINVEAAQRLLAAYGTFAATERLLMELVKRGGDRQALHEKVRQHSLAAWPDVAAGRPNPLAEYLAGDAELLGLAPAEEIRGWLVATDHIGDAPARAGKIARDIRELATRLERDHG